MVRKTRSSLKRAANVSVSGSLLDQARAAGVNLSATLEDALAEELRKRQREQWKTRNREAIALYNDYLERHGAFSDGLRHF